MTAYPVAEGRCAHCGRQPPLWTPERIVNAVIRWTALRGRPPKTRDWRRATWENPSSQTVVEVFGSFRPVYQLAGVESPLRANALREWTREQIIEAIFQFVFEHGRLPRAREWNAATDRWPATATVRRHFGAWNAAIVAAGYEPTHAKRSLAGYRVVTGATRRQKATA